MYIAIATQRKRQSLLELMNTVKNMASQKLQTLSKIRPAQSNDAIEISELIIKSVDFFHSENYTEKELAIWRRGYSPDKVEQQIMGRLSFVAEMEDKLCGFIQFDPPEIKGFYIHPKFGRKGIGSALLNHLLGVLTENGQEHVELTSNKLVVGFYKKFGFDLVGEEIVHWENHPFIEFRMTKNLQI